MAEHVFSADNNRLTVCGYLMDDLAYDHTIMNENFYSSVLVIPRYSETNDFIPIIISERLVDVDDMVEGKWIRVDGQFRSHNLVKSEDDNKPVYKLSIFAQDVYELKEEEDQYGFNEIALNGFLCKQPRYRTTPSGREITDLYIAVNRARKKSDYLPCISWGRNARYTESLPIGTHVELTGRIQSREYHKKLDDETTELRMCYEISVNTISEVYEEQPDYEKTDTEEEPLPDEVE